jgi:hypothetical protein
MKKGISATIVWDSQKVLFDIRVFLFCFSDKCMSGKIVKIEKKVLPNRYKIEVDFFEPSFFEKEAYPNAEFTINEASRVLGRGIVDEVL